MKGLYVCGSFRFTREMESVEHMLEEENIKYQISKKMDSRGILGCLREIDNADVVYIVNPEGYVGKSVSVDIGYAYARNKVIYLMHPVDDPPVMDLIDGILSPKALIDFLRRTLLLRCKLRNSWMTIFEFFPSSNFNIQFSLNRFP